MCMPGFVSPLEIAVQTFSPQKLRAARLAAGLSHERVALAVGRSSFTTRGYELGTSTPPASIIGRLADVLGADVADLFTRNGGDDDA